MDGPDKPLLHVRELSAQTRARVDALRRRDHEDVGELGRTTVLLHEDVRPIAVVLLHGLSASPMQFARFARALHERGHNVVVPRLPRHGYRDRLSDALATLTANDLCSLAHESIELATQLGDRVVVAGFSLGGLLATWIAQHEAVERVVAIAPFLGAAWIPNRWMEPLSELLLRLPNRFLWWNPLVREKQQPEHGYPRYATHAIGEAHRLARAVLEHASHHRPRAKYVTVVTNASEGGVNNRAIRRLIERMRRMHTDITHVRLTGLPLSHDIIEPLRHPALADRVFPRLLALIEGEDHE